MRIRHRLATAAVAFAALAVLVPQLGGAGAGADASVPITFSHGQPVDVQRLSAEPEIKSDSHGNLYVTGPIGTQYGTSFLWKSEDGGAGFDLLRAAPPLQRPNPHFATGDNTMTILPPAAGKTQDTLVWSDMVALAGLQNIATFDGGNSFPPDYWNVFANKDPGGDRQWLASGKVPGTNTYRIFQFYDRYPFGNMMLYSDDYGKTWTEGTTSGVGSPNPGNIAYDPVHGKVYAATVSGSTALVSVCDVDVRNCAEQPAGRGTSGLANLFDIVDVDSAGNVYLAFSDSKFVYLSISTDQGETWHQITVSPASQKTTVMPWVVAGDPGRVWVLWYGTTRAAAPSANAGPWNVYGAQSLNALDASPAFSLVTISEHANHDNEICEGGIGCTAGFGPLGSSVGGSPEDRNMLDDFTADIDQRGMLHVVYNDTNNQVTESPTDPQAGGAYVIHAVQQSGPSLYSSVGDVAPTPAAPAITAATAAAGTLTASGTQSLPAGNWGSDAAGDALFPRHSVTGPGPNDPGLDLKAAYLRWVDGSTPALAAHIDLASAPTPTTAGGKPVVYLVFFWAPPGNVYYAAAQAIGGTVVKAWVGRPTPVSWNTGGVVKIAGYQLTPGFSEPTTVTQQGSSLDIAIPLSAVGNLAKGTRLDQVTGFSLVPVAGPGSETLMDEADATPATSWIAGDGRLAAGSVQLSVDDPSFAAPVTATLTNYPSSDAWSANIDVSLLSPGQHTLYARQVVGGFASQATATPFSVG